MFQYIDCPGVRAIFRWDIETCQGSWYGPDGTRQASSVFSWDEMTGKYRQSSDRIVTPDWADPDLQLPEGM